MPACGCQDVGIQSDIKYIFKYKKSEKGHILRHIQAAPTAVYSQVSPYFPYENFFYEICRDRLFWKPSLPIHEVSRPWGIKAYVVPYRERRSWWARKPSPARMHVWSLRCWWSEAHLPDRTGARTWDHTSRPTRRRSRSAYGTTADAARRLL